MAVSPQEAVRPLSVTELNTRIHDLLAGRFQSVLIKGEVSGVSASRGHVWFTLKDAGAAIGAVIFSSTARRLPFLPLNGQELIVTCQVDFHTQSGRVTLVVSRLDYDGAGKLRLAIEQLKRRLEQEGAFSPARKRPLPMLPHRIGLVTSPTGAVIHDLQQTIWERFPNVHLMLYPAAVQGTASQRSLTAALRQCDRDGLAEVCIVARGGGSFEELMAFNQEAVIRAIQAMRIPVITALGHTSDRTLADLVADREARTPTAAAELVVPVKRDLQRQLEERASRLLRAGLGRLVGPTHEVTARRRDLQRGAAEVTARRGERLRTLQLLLAQRDPREVLKHRQDQLSVMALRFGRAVEGLRRRAVLERERATGLREQLTVLASRGVRAEERALAERGRRLEGLGPKATLQRGYSICVERETGTIVRASAQTRVGTGVRVVLDAGEIDCRVEEVRP
ncbi:MAG TPA: exodeoxyribonuclease VII large subunit [Candidatus Limnocylindrales bacterium]|nr:exodeoxyribonuclease VII large subunit [Candidatus Limnocylindrales bacterium]